MFGITRTTAEIDAIAGCTADDVERLRQTWEGTAERKAKVAAFDAYMTAKIARRMAQRTGTPRH